MENLTNEALIILTPEHMMTSSNGNIFRVTGHLCGEFTGPGEFPPQRPVTRSFDVFFDLRLNKRLSKQSCGWWFETPSRPLWRQCNEVGGAKIGLVTLVVITGTTVLIHYVQSGATANFGDRIHCQIWGPNIQKKIFTFWHMNINELDLNSDSFFGEPEVEILQFWHQNLVIQENREKIPRFETKAVVSFLMPQGVFCLR